MFGTQPVFVMRVLALRGGISSHTPSPPPARDLGCAKKEKALGQGEEENDRGGGRMVWRAIRAKPPRRWGVMDLERGGKEMERAQEGGMGRLDGLHTEVPSTLQ